MGEHVELHAIWSILNGKNSGYRNHPEVKRWVGHEPALYDRHDMLVDEMTARGYNHKSPLAGYIDGSYDQPEPWDDQEVSLSEKHCDCQTELVGLS